MLSAMSVVSVCSSHLTHEDEMTSNIGSTGLIACVRLIEIFDIVGLQDEYDNPVYTGNDRVQRKGRVMVVVLTPNCMALAMFLAVRGCGKGVVDSCYDYQ